MARLIGVTATWYGKLERGEPGNYSDDFLERTAYALRLSDEEKMMLYLYAAGREPSSQDKDPQPTLEVTEGLRRIVDEQPWPAYISDVSWDVVHYNQHMRDWFPWVGYEQNVMRWVFTYPEARQQLYNWETDWAPLMLAQMRVANGKYPENMRLARLIQEITRVNDYARDLWDNQPAVYVHPDGDRRKLHLPHHRKIIEIEIVANSPMRAPSARLMMLIPIPERTDRGASPGGHTARRGRARSDRDAKA